MTGCIHALELDAAADPKGIAVDKTAVYSADD
jgi:hypothetical protein